MADREGRWLCKSCGAECRGRDESCNGLSGKAGCGVARPKKGVGFYLPENSPIVTDPELLADANSGVDWHCDHCDGANKGSYNGHRTLSCVHCGNARDRADEDLSEIDYAMGQTPRTAETAEAPRERNRRAVAQEALQVEAGKVALGCKASVKLWGAGLCIVILAAGLIWSLFIASYPATVKVTAFSWERSISISEKRVIRESDWDVPDGGRLIDTDIKIRSYKDVHVRWDARIRMVDERYVTGSEPYTCGQTDLGNGFFRDKICNRPTYGTRKVPEDYKVEITKKVPVTDSWETYDIDRWIINQTPKSQGKDQTPKWPEYALRGPLERIETRAETYRVALHDEEADISRVENILQDLWSDLVIGQEIPVIKDYWGGVREINWDQR